MSMFEEVPRKEREDWKWLFPSPRWEHDCETCYYLGQFEDMDLYVHVDEKGYLSTYVARQSSQDSDYVSGKAFVGHIPAITAAHEKAQSLGRALDLS